jgi:succinoglycan biosynthesis protein ExoA
MKNQNVKVSVLIPCRNEASHIEACLANVYSFVPPVGGFEVIVIDGMSTDGTRETLKTLQEHHKDLTVLDNPCKLVPHAMNIGIMHAKGEYIVRTDARCVHPKTYLVDLIDLIERTKAANVGGVLVPQGTTYIQRSIAHAYKSPIAMGGALRDRGEYVGETDAVYGGCFQKQRLLDIGLYDERMVRNQDDELSFRLRKQGGKVIQSGAIKVRYFPRKHFKQLFKQFLQYGYWKVLVLDKHPHQASWRHYAPAALVLGLAGLGISSLFSSTGAVVLYLFAGSYLLVIALESLRVTVRTSLSLLPGVFIAIICIHMGFGSGFLLGLVSRLLKMKTRWFETLSR